jgi:copper chaperone NosL
MRIWTGMAAAALVVSAACGTETDGPPHIEVDRTACAHCGMLVSEPVYASAYRRGDGEARVFDDIGCLLKAAGGETDRANLRFWFHDAAAAPAAVWIDRAEAVLVRSGQLRTPMDGGYVAYRGDDAARRGAARHQGEVAGRLDDVLRSKGL